MDGKVTQARSMGISLSTSGKITEKGKLPSVGVTTQLEKVSLRLPVVTLPPEGKALLRIKPKQKKADS